MSLFKIKNALAATALTFVGAGVCLFGATTDAGATTLTFDQITNNTGLDASDQISVSVDDGTHLGSDGAIFYFEALTGALASFSMAELYWSDIGGLFTPPPIELSSSAGVNIVEGNANPGNLPAGNDASPAFTVTTGLLADAPRANSNAIGIGEFYEVFLAYDTGIDFNDVLADLIDGDLRVGIHVRSHNGGGSESYVGGGICNSLLEACAPSISTVPLPAGLPLLLMALGGIGIVSRRRATA